MMNTVISEIFSPHRVRNFAANLSEFCIGFHFHFAFGMWFTVFLTIARDSRLQLNPDIFEPEVGHSVRSRIFRQRTKVGRACSSGVPRSSPAAIASRCREGSRPLVSNRTPIFGEFGSRSLPISQFHAIYRMKRKSSLGSNQYGSFQVPDCHPD